MGSGIGWRCLTIHSSHPIGTIASWLCAYCRSLCNYCQKPEFLNKSLKLYDVDMKMEGIAVSGKDYFLIAPMGESQADKSSGLPNPGLIPLSQVGW